MGRFAALALVVCIVAAPASAQQAPDATIQRIAEINTQLSEIDYLWNTHQIPDQARRERRAPLETELAGLNQEIRRLSIGEQQRAGQEIRSLTSARLAILQPQWQKRAQELKAAREQQDRETIAAIPSGAREALEPQRRRVLLQQRRQRAEITAEEFAAEDKKALDEIVAIRTRYAGEGGRYGDYFDSQLRLLTQTIATDPSALIPVSRVPARGTGTGADDYQKDVALAANLSAKLNDINRQLFAKKLDNALYRESERVYQTDLNRLIEKWRAAGRGAQFERDYRQYGAPPRPNVRGAVNTPGPSGAAGVTVPASGLWGTSAAVFALVILLGLYSELKPYRFVAGEGHAPVVQAGFRHYTVYSVSGIVVGSSVGVESITHVSSTGNMVTSSVERHVHREFFIKHAHGEEPIQLTDVDLPLRDGQVVSAIWAIRRFSKRGPFIVFRNHTTNTDTFIDATPWHMLQPRLWPLMATFALSIALELTVIAGTSRSFDLGPVLVLCFFATLAWVPTRLLLGFLRARRFKKRDVPVLLAGVQTDSIGRVSPA